MKLAISCDNCGKEIFRYQSQIKNTNFCCEPCMFEYRNKNRICKGESHGSWNGGPARVFCKTCGKEFYVRKSQLAKNRGQYCSLQCKYHGKFVIKLCQVCGKEFSLKKSHDVNGHGKYCSLSCRSIGYKINGIFVGENNPRYIDGQSQSLEYVRKASNDRRVKEKNNGGTYEISEWIDLCNKYDNRCLCCGDKNARLTIDHVVPVSLGGANDIANLQPLCKSCNSRKHNKTIDYR